MDDVLKLKCEICGCDYEKPKEYREYVEKNVYFRWSLEYCDKCRREKEMKALSNLGNVVDALVDID